MQFVDRLAEAGVHDATDPFDIEEYDNAAVRRIQRHVRAFRRGI